MPDLIQELSFYRKYHYNKVNVFIHVCCIPLILLTAVYNLTALKIPEPILSAIDLDAKYYPYANFATVLSVCYGVYYIMLDLPMGLPCALILNFASMQFCKLAPQLGSSGYRRSWSIHAVSWLLQFIGHGVFEKRAPALLDNLVQALVLAPFFAVFELFYFMGFRRDVIENIDKKVLPEIKAFHAARQGKAS